MVLCSLKTGLIFLWPYLKLQLGSSIFLPFKFNMSLRTLRIDVIIKIIK